MSGRKLFWTIFLLLACGTGWYMYYNRIDQVVARNLKLLEHPHADVAAEAWHELSDLFFTKWEAFYPILEHVRTRKKISFLIEREFIEFGGEEKEVFVARRKPVFYRAESEQSLVLSVCRHQCMVNR